VKTRFVRFVAVACVVAVGVLVACSDAPVQQPPPPPPAGAPGAPGPHPSVVASASVADLPKLVFNDSDFTESDTSRDPFHNFAKLFAPTAASISAPQYTVILDKFSVDELKLVAIVKSNEGMRAMFVDPQGKGWVVTRGMHIGKGEIVRLGTGITSAYPLFWKVDQIKDDSVVLVREDALHPEVPPTYREIPLHVEGEKT
jgi:type IV pilus assembly protein PilP